MAMTISVSGASSASSAPNTPPANHEGSQSPLASSPNTVALPPPVDASPTAQGQIGQVAAQQANGSAPPKRKPSRRANTAERRATHNAVERARRETLNGRFLDLAALLPNLSQIRRPSKSSIVNSSIAHIHASRRHRLLAARELRLLKVEADALRRELNEWRDRSALPRVEEPIRGESFQMILSGEVEPISINGPIEEEGEDGFGPDDFVGDDDFNGGVQMGSVPSQANDHQNPAADLASFAHVAAPPNNGSLHLQTVLPARSHGPTGPMIVQSPTGVSFDNPAMPSMYEHGMPIPNQQFFAAEKVGAWNAQMFQGGGSPPQVAQQFTPPASSHGPSVTPPINVASQQAYIMNLRQQQAMMQQQGHVFGSPVDGDDTSSTSSTPGSQMRRERSGSMNSIASGGYTPNVAGSPANSASSFDSVGILGGGRGSPGNGGVPRRMNSGMNGWDQDMMMNGMAGLGGMGGPMGMMNAGGMAGMMKSQAISVGGGGNSQGFAAMMMM